MIELLAPTETLLPEYVAALRRGWLPDNIRGAQVAAEQLTEIAHDPAGFVQKLADDREATGGPIKMPDGSSLPRLPGFIRWIWDGEFCGAIGFRWQSGTAVLPQHVLGHIGFSVVPWKRRRGYAQRALALMLDAAREEGLTYVELTTDPDNIVSQKVILANGGLLAGRFNKMPQYGSSLEGFRYRIML